MPDQSHRVLGVSTASFVRAHKCPGADSIKECALRRQHSVSPHAAAIGLRLPLRPAARRPPLSLEGLANEPMEQMTSRSSCAGETSWHSWSRLLVSHMNQPKQWRRDPRKTGSQRAVPLPLRLEDGQVPSCSITIDLHAVSERQMLFTLAKAARWAASCAPRRRQPHLVSLCLGGGRCVSCELAGHQPVGVVDLSNRGSRWTKQYVAS